MLRIFRKYNKLILVIGGSFLMVVFLLPQAVQQFGPNPRKLVYFRVDGKAFRGRDVAEAGQDLQRIEQIQRTTAQETGITPFVLPLQIQGPSHWLMLTYEAERLGLIGGPEGGRDLLEEIARQTAQTRFMFQNQGQDTSTQQAQLEARILEGLKAGWSRAVDRGVPEEMVNMTLARLRGVRRLMSLSGTIPTLSTREAAWFGRDFLATATADVVVIGTEDLRGRVEEPTEEELRAHFEEYKSVRASENEYGIGYLRPPAVRVETLLIDRSVIREAIRLDPIEVNKYWRQNQDRFGSSFATARPNVESQLKTQKVEQIVGKIEELLRREFFKATRDLPTLEGGYRELPAGWDRQRPNYDVLAAQINDLVASEVELGQDQPATVILADEWLDRQALASHPAASAMVTIGGSRLPFSDLVMGVRELKPEAELGIQQDLTFGPIEIQGYRIFHFRVDDARPESPPDSLDEVRAQVRQDVIDLRAYELLKAEQESIRAQIVDTGTYLDLYDRFPQSVLARSGMTITRDTVRPASGASPLPEANKESLRDAVVDVIEGWDPMTVASTVPIEDRVVGIELPDELSLAFAIITGYHPMTREQLRQNDYRVMQAAQQSWGGATALSPFTFESISERLGYEVVERRGSRDEEAEGEGAEEAPGEASG